jgi:hypothetical protein
MNSLPSQILERWLQAYFDITFLFMNYNTKHQNFIILSKLSMVDYLSKENVWTELILVLTPFIIPIKGVYNITAEQFVKGKGSLKIGRLTWKNEVLHKLIDNYNSCSEKDKFSFSHFAGYFPNLTTCVKANVTPQVTLIINDTYSDRKFFGSGFFISFREDYYYEIGEQDILKGIENISKLLKSVFRLKIEREYAKPYLGGWTDSLQDLFPTTAANIKEDNLVVSEGFKDWQQF